jgi:hypothetical protein
MCSAYVLSCCGSPSPAANLSMGKSPPVSEFVRAAIREKASRELLVLQQRETAFEGMGRAQRDLSELSVHLATTASALAALPPDAHVLTKVRRLRKAVEEASALSTEVAEALAVGDQREIIATARGEILRAMAEVGLDPDAIAVAAE